MLRQCAGRRAAVVVAFCVLAAGCGGGQSGRTPTTDLSHITHFYDMVFTRVARDGVNSTRAGWIYANISLAMLMTHAPVDAAAAELLDRVDGAPTVKPPAGLDADIATVAAAASVARALFPDAVDRSTLAQARDTSLAQMSKGLDRRVLASSVSFGVRVAAAVVQRASRDGSAEAAAPPAEPLVNVAGQWVPTPPAFQPPSDPGWGNVRRFMKGTDKCTLPEPPAGANPASPYEEAATEVKTVSANLTDLQKAVARFWDDGRGRTGTPAGHWVNIALAVSVKKHKSVARTVTIVAAASMAMADALAGAWGVKFARGVERPVTVILRSDPTWQPYLETPAHPGYPSAHSAVSRAAADILTHYLDETAFGDPGYGMTVKSRRDHVIKKQYFESFRAAADQAAMSRLYAGVTYRMSIRAGERLGACVGLKVTTGLPD